MKKSVILLRIGAFLGIFAVLFVIVTAVLKDKRIGGEYNPTTKVRGFYEEEQNSLDFVFIGSSQVYADIAPAVLWRDYGITSYNFTANEQPMWISYYYIKEALKHQNPQAIVLDVFTVYGETYEEEGVNHINLDDLPWSMNKVQAIMDSVPKELRYSFFFELAKYHTTWEGLTEEKFKTSFQREKDPMKGYSPFVFAREYGETAPEAVINQQELQPIPDKAKEWLCKIIDLCSQEGVELVLIKTPNGNADRQKLYNSVSVLAKEKNVPFLNLNTQLDGEAHINVLQAEKVTSYVGEYLAEHFELTDKRGQKGYDDWEESVTLFERYKKKCQVISSDTFSEYLACVAGDEDLCVLIGAKNVETKCPQEMTEALIGLGLNCDTSQLEKNGYLTVLDGGNVIYEVQSEGDVKEVLHCGDKEITMKFGVGEDGSKECSMKLDGLDYSMDMDGFNIVIYDKVLKETYEMVAFDATNEFAIVRK